MRNLLIVALVGLGAQLVDGSVGMGYGVTSATLLLATGVTPAAASAAIHLSEIGTSLVSGVAHHRLGNTDWRTVSILAVPGFLGAFGGAFVLASLDADLARPVVAAVLLALGGWVTFRFLAIGTQRLTFGPHPSPFFLAPLGLVAGGLDALGGGGWGPVGTTTLLSSGRLEPRKVVGSVDTAEFVVALGGSLGFLLSLGVPGVEWAAVGALMVGGIIAAPIAAYVVRLLPARILGVLAGGVIVLTNAVTLADLAGASDLSRAMIAAGVFTLWVLWVSWAVRIEESVRTGVPIREARSARVRGLMVE